MHSNKGGERISSDDKEEIFYKFLRLFHYDSGDNTVVNKVAAREKIKEFLTDRIVAKYPSFVEYMKIYLFGDGPDYPKAESWMLEFRKIAELRGHNTNNAAEWSFNAQQYTVMRSTKSINPFFHVLFLIGELEDYYISYILTRYI